MKEVLMRKKILIFIILYVCDSRAMSSLGKNITFFQHKVPARQLFQGLVNRRPKLELLRKKYGWSDWQYRNFIDNPRLLRLEAEIGSCNSASFESFVYGTLFCQDLLYLEDHRTIDIEPFVCKFNEEIDQIEQGNSTSFVGVLLKHGWSDAEISRLLSVIPISAPRINEVRSYMQNIECPLDGRELSLLRYSILGSTYQRGLHKLKNLSDPQAKTLMLILAYDAVAEWRNREFMKSLTTPIGI